MTEANGTGRVNLLHNYERLKLNSVHTYVQSRLGHIKTVSTFPALREPELDEHMARALSIKENPWVFSELSGFVEVLFWWSYGNLGTGGLLGSVQCWTFPPWYKGYMLFFSPFSPSLFNLFSLAVALMRHQKPMSRSCDLVLLKPWNWSFWCVMLWEKCKLVMGYSIWNDETHLMVSDLHFCCDVRDSWSRLRFVLY